MAAARKTRKKAPQPPPPLLRRVRVWLWRKLRWVIIAPALIALALMVAYTVFNPPTTYTMWSEGRRLDGVDQQWVPLREIAPVIPRAIIAAEDANFCLHWGFDMAAIRNALEDGAARGASTISQQTVKNVFLWQERSWFRKALEALMTPVAELLWSKQRMLEIYLNVAEFDEGVFGIDAASYHYYKKGPSQLSASEAARLAVVLPNPKGRNPNRLTNAQARKARQAQSGAATILKDGRAACFED